MDEDIGSFAFRRDEAEALVLIEKLNLASRHDILVCLHLLWSGSLAFAFCEINPFRTFGLLGILICLRWRDEVESRQEDRNGKECRPTTNERGKAVAAEIRQPAGDDVGRRRSDALNRRDGGQADNEVSGA